MISKYFLYLKVFLFECVEIFFLVCHFVFDFFMVFSLERFNFYVNVLFNF